mmetsp:Transcript_18721/g.25308  ORF Transcript_18721/g.25308 Transcript_18721/m.25308 type:complete len:84 (+) Transcript_18721:641-892(+)|eukprot:CAMPEP_0185587536 /NCGR_PEP_ID=MMETSP0434-20130131/49505_1 /TAXON_ID=626734 ORGANISM="Favella taraikaensis, Strain Fe Narragansett Bay" /NCGR_SAMPLE_ID=MMETSP0434 /ASSEMBLY_ACC=CAM_ASM_000379 /LENGTH=83 /DNA_ID=CAMNT_0028209491 /DNA_START=230 /DNA_END=481 /DNA_ORIENTATION=-
MRQTSQTTCFENLYMRNFNNRGFLGVTSRNSDRFQKSLEVNQVKVNNMDPNFYREQDIAQDRQPEKNKKELEWLDSEGEFELE